MRADVKLRGGAHFYFINALCVPTFLCESSIFISIYIVSFNSVYRPVQILLEHNVPGISQGSPPLFSEQNIFFYLKLKESFSQTFSIFLYLLLMEDSRLLICDTWRKIDSYKVNNILSKICFLSLKRTWSEYVSSSFFWQTEHPEHWRFVLLHFFILWMTQTEIRQLVITQTILKKRKGELDGINNEEHDCQRTMNREQKL